MQKKILASILVTPLAFNALADANLDYLKDPSQWTESGISGDADVFTDTEGGYKAESVIGIGTFTQTIKNLPKGTYRVSLQNPENAQVTVKIGAQEIKPGTDTFEFNISLEKADVTITIAAIDQSKTYSFANPALELVYDFDAQQTLLTDALGAVTLETVNPDDKSAEAVQLRKDKAALESRIAAITGNIAELDNETLDTYKKFHLYNTPNDIAAAITQLAADAKAYNDRVTAENDLYDTIQANTAARDALLGADGVQGLRTALQAVQTKINATNNDYVKEQCNPGVTEIGNEITAYENAIKEAYKDLTKKGITFDDAQHGVISQEISDLSNKVDQALADWNAYQAFQQKKVELMTAFDQAWTLIAELKGIEGFDTIYTQMISVWQTQINDKYNDTLNGFGIKTDVIEGAAGFVTDDIANAEAAIKFINNVLAAAQEMVKNQNDAMTAANSAYDAVATRFNTFLHKLVPEQYAAQYQQQIADIREALASVRTNIDEEYTRHNLTAEDYETALADITAQIDDLEEFLTHTTPLITLAQDLAALKVYIIEESKKADLKNTEGETIVDIYSKFLGTFESLHGAIDDLTLESTPEEIKVVADGIAAEKVNAKNLIDAFEAANVAVKDFAADLNTLKGVVDAKEIFKGSAYNKNTFLNGTYKVLTNHLTGFKDDLTAAADLNAQDCYEAAKALSETIAQYDAETQVDNATKEFETDATEANYKVVENLLAQTKTNQDTGEYLYKETIDFTDVDTELDRIDGNLTTAEDTTPTPVKDFTQVDKDLKTLITEINKIQETIDALKANEKAYQDLWNLATPNLDDLLAALIQHNIDTSLTPAEEYYANLINGDDNASSLAAQIQKIKDAIDAAHTGKTAVEEKDALTADITAMENAITAMTQAITDNETAHNAQLAASDRIRKTINDYIDEINDAAIASGAPASLVADWISALNGLLKEGATVNDVDVTGLVPVDRDVNQAYGEGASESNNTDFLAYYKAIEDAANAIYSDYDNQYGQRVFDTNANTTQGWAGTLNDMNKAYTDAINTYNAFTYQLHNENYRAVIIPVVKTHEGIFMYYQEIAQVNEAFKTWLADQNSAKHVITEAEYAARVKIATDLIEEIEGKVNLMVMQVNATAVNYYNTLYGQCFNAIAQAKTTLENAGLTTAEAVKALANAQGYLDAANSMHAAAVAENPGNIILPMDNVADQLDLVQPAIDLNSAALGKWDASFADATAAFNALGERLNKCGETIKNDNIAALVAHVVAADALDYAAQNDKSLIDNLKAQLDQLAQILADAENIVTAAEQLKANIDAENAAHDNYYNVVIPGLEDAYKALVEYVNSLSSAEETNLQAAKVAVDNVKEVIARNHDQLTVPANETAINNAITAAYGQIDAAYLTAFGFEKDALNKLLADTKVAFNNSKVNGNLDTATLNGYDEAIRQLDGKIQVMTNGITVADKDTFRTNAQAYAQQLSDIYVALMKSYTIVESDQVVSGGDPLPGIIDALQAQFNETATAISDAQAVLDGASDEAKALMGEAVQQYADELTALNTALGNQNSGWEADGNVVVISKDKYAQAMIDILGQADNLKSQITNAVQTAQQEADRRAASNAQYDVLNTELQGYRDTLEALRATAEEFGVLDLYEGMLDNIERMINVAQDDIDALKPTYGLTAQTQLTNKSDITSQLASATANIHYTYTTNEELKARAAVKSAKDAVIGNIVPSVKSELETKVNDLITRSNNLHDAVAAITLISPDQLDEFINTLAGYRTEAAAIAAEANSIVTTAGENRFTPGDVNLNPDGVVNVADVQMVINWIGEGMTYQQLAEESPRQAAAADVNGDKDLNIADVTAIIQMALDYDYEATTEGAKAAPRMALAKGVRQSQNTMGMVLMSEEGNTRTYALALANTDALIGGQIDLTLPAGVELVSATLTERAAGHDLYRFDNSNGARLVIASLANEQISGNEGALLIIEVKGHGVVEAENVIFADANSTALKIGKADTTMIEAITNGMHNMKERVYNVAGQIMRSAQRGINIIRHSDGTTTKEMH